MLDLNECFKNQKYNFCQLCYTVYYIAKYFDDNYVGKEKKTNEYFDKEKLFLKFGLDRTVSRLSNCYKRFMTGFKKDEVNLKSWYEGFSPSKLFEMLKISNLTLEESIDKKLIKPDMTVKEIRNYIKQISYGKDKADKVLQKDNEPSDEEIPMAYNPKNHYDFDYFEMKTKSQLLNMIWELQKEYERLKEKKQ